MLSGDANAETIRILSQADIASILTPSQVIDRVEEAYAWKAQGKTTTFPLVFHEFEPGISDMDIKSGHLQPAGLFGLKLVSFFEENSKRGLPQLQGLIALFDDTTGQAQAIMEGTHLTGLRTGAAAAIGAKYLARPESETFLIVGAGHQCLFQIGAMLSAFQTIKKVLVCDPLDYEHALTRVALLRKDAEKTIGMELPISVDIEAVESLEMAVRVSDIITTVTPSRKPLILDPWVQPGTHLSCVGSDMPGKQELDPSILSRARIFVDDLSQCLEVGEIELGIKAGIISPDDIVGELGSIPIGEIMGRTSKEDITVFDTTGIALQDLAAARAALDAAEAADLGCIAPL